MKPPIRFEVYKDQKGEWRWRAVRKNGRTMADSGEGYRSRASARAAVTKIVALIRQIEISVYAKTPWLVDVD